MTADSIITIRISNDDKTLLTEAAQREGQTLSAYMRDSALARADITGNHVTRRTCITSDCPNHGKTITITLNSPAPGVIASPDLICAHCGFHLYHPPATT